MKFLIREIMLFIFQTIGIAGLKIMFGQWKMSGLNGNLSVASHVDRSRTLSFLNYQPNPPL